MVDFMRFSLLMSSIISIEPRRLPAFPCSLIRGSMVTLTETFSPPTVERGIHEDVGCAAVSSTHLDALQDPGFGRRRRIRAAGLLQDLLEAARCRIRSPAALQVAIRPLLVQRDDAVGHDSAASPRCSSSCSARRRTAWRSPGDRNLRGERAQPRLVFVGERPAALVQHLGDADGLAGLLTIGTHRIERVKKPVFLSNAGLKRRSA